MESHIRQMFEAIVPSYDLLNRVLSFGMDVIWRRRAVNRLQGRRVERVLDVAAGTGDFALAARCLDPLQIIAADFVPEMLQVARRKMQKRARWAHANSAPYSMHLIAADALRLPLRRETCDVVMVAFGMRNFPDKPAALREMYRVLRPQGVVCVLELSRPPSRLFGRIFRWYFHRIVPTVGRVISGHPNAYRYLPDSVDGFPDPTEFLSAMDAVGFQQLKRESFTFGIVSLYIASKP